MAAAEDELEFRSYPDDAWYSVRAVCDGEKLRIKYSNFPGDHDDVFEASKFESLEKLEEFRFRFRQMSVQLQDRECFKVVEGLYLCASHAFSDNDVRFYDAVVEHVIHKKHSFGSGDGECLCSFIILWQHGPLAGKLVEKKVENICLIQSSTELDQNVASFLKTAAKKIGTKCDVMSLSQIRPSEGWIGNISESNRQDTDIGGVGNHYMVLLENLEKDLSPSTIIEFIHRQTSITCQAFVYPSLSSELYTRGAIVLDTEKDLENLCGFFNDPDHIVISSRGRPWVVAKSFTRHFISTLSNGTFMPKSEKKSEDSCTGISHELKLVHFGTEGYRKAKQLKDLFLEFSFHQERLHKRLAMEEKKILRPSPSL